MFRFSPLGLALLTHSITRRCNNLIIDSFASTIYIIFCAAIYSYKNPYLCLRNEAVLNRNVHIGLNGCASYEGVFGRQIAL